MNLQKLSGEVPQDGWYYYDGMMKDSLGALSRKARMHYNGTSRPIERDGYRLDWILYVNENQGLSSTTQ